MHVVSFEYFRHGRSCVPLRSLAGLLSGARDPYASRIPDGVVSYVVPVSSRRTPTTWALRYGLGKNTLPAGKSSSSMGT